MGTKSTPSPLAISCFQRPIRRSRGVMQHQWRWRATVVKCRLETPDLADMLICAVRLASCGHHDARRACRRRRGLQPGAQQSVICWPCRLSCEGCNHATRVEHTSSSALDNISSQRAATYQTQVRLSMNRSDKWRRKSVRAGERGAIVYSFYLGFSGPEETKLQAGKRRRGVGYEGPFFNT